MVTLPSPLLAPPPLEPPPHAVSATVLATSAADTARNFLAVINLSSSLSEPTRTWAAAGHAWHAPAVADP
jgi:hypothetical protein